MSRNRKKGMVLGFVGFAVWCGSIALHAPALVDKFTFFITTLKSLSFIAYIMPVSFLLYSLSSFLQRRVSMMSLGLLLTLMSGAYIYNFSFTGDLVGVSVISVLCLLYPIFAGRGRNI